jgi:hypothetical protein
VVALSGSAQCIEDNTWLDTGKLFLRIEFKESTHVLRHVENDSGVAGLPGKTRASPTWKKRDMIEPAEGNGLNNILYVFGKNHANGHLTIVGTIGGIQCPASSIKAHFAINAATQSISKSLRILRNARCCPGAGCFEYGKERSHG